MMHKRIPRRLGELRTLGSKEGGGGGQPLLQYITLHDDDSAFLAYICIYLAGGSATNPRSHYWPRRGEKNISSYGFLISFSSLQLLLKPLLSIVSSGPTEAKAP